MRTHPTDKRIELSRELVCEECLKIVSEWVHLRTIISYHQD